MLDKSEHFFDIFFPRGRKKFLVSQFTRDCIGRPSSSMHRLANRDIKPATYVGYLSYLLRTPFRNTKDA